MADATDLKSVIPWVCGFESRFEHFSLVDSGLIPVLALIYLDVRYMSRCLRIFEFSAISVTLFNNRGYKSGLDIVYVDVS